MKVNAFKRISSEDFDPEIQPAIEKLGFALNPFMDQLIQAFNKNIDFDNLNQEVVEFTVQVSSDGKPTTAVELKSNLRNRVRGYSVIRVQLENVNGTPPTSSPLISYSQSEELVKISNVTGLVPNVRYRITAIAIG